MKQYNERTLIDARWSRLKEMRAPFLHAWQDVSKYIQPLKGRYFVSDHRRAENYANAIINSEAVAAHRILVSGLMNGATNQAHPWFRLALEDDDLMQHHSVKDWLANNTRVMESIFTASNTYQMLKATYQALCGFGISAAIIEQNFDRVIHHHTVPAGSYAVDVDEFGFVNMLYREMRLSVFQLVSKFGYNNCSPTVRNMYDKGNLNDSVPVMHVIEPRTDRIPGKRDAANMPFKSCYFETGSDPDKYLRQSGMRRFRVLCPRWDVEAGEAYGNFPALEALGDTKQLQLQERDKTKVINYRANPPLVAPTSLKNINRMPGGISYYDGMGNNSITRLFETTGDINDLSQDIERVQMRIRRAFHTNLFQAFNADDGRMTATEVAIRNSDRLQLLGTVLQNLHKELLEPLIEHTFDFMLEGGLVSPPPEELEGQELKVEFVSPLAQAQRSSGVAEIERFIGTMGMIAQTRPEAVDKLEVDTTIDRLADKLGIDPDLIVSNENVAIIRQDRASQQQAMMQTEQAALQARTARELSQADIAGDNALTAVAAQA